jgi:hypothetical protein
MQGIHNFENENTKTVKGVTCIHTYESPFNIKYGSLNHDKHPCVSNILTILLYK